MVRVRAKDDSAVQSSPPLDPLNGVQPRDSVRGIIPYLLDSVYLSSLLFTVPYLFCAGRARSVMDHLRRRSRQIPQRTGNRPCVWVHGVSVGEILSARHFLHRFSEHFPEWECLLSTTTRAGIEAGKRHYPNCKIFSYPFDLSFLVKRAFDNVRPDLVIIVEHELWPNFLKHAEARGVPVVLVNGRLSKRSFKGYRWLSRVMSWPPKSVVKVCAEDEISARGFSKLGVDRKRIQVTGNFKFDNTATPTACMRKELGIANSDWVLLAGSTHNGEEEPIVDAFMRIRAADSQARLVLAPRRVERVGEISRLLERRGLQARLWSEVSTAYSNGTAPASKNGRASNNGSHDHITSGSGGNGQLAESNDASGYHARERLDGSGTNGIHSGNAGGSDNGNGHVVTEPVAQADQVILVDTIGELQKIAAVANVVFVGGSLIPFGGHNVIEPAALGRPVLIGPHHDNFRQVVSAFLENDAVIIVHSAEELYQHLHQLKTSPQTARRLGERAAQTVARNTGASERTFQAIRPIVTKLSER